MYIYMHMYMQIYMRIAPMAHAVPRRRLVSATAVSSETRKYGRAWAARRSRKSKRCSRDNCRHGRQLSIDGSFVVRGDDIPEVSQAASQCCDGRDPQNQSAQYTYVSISTCNLFNTILLLEKLGLRSIRNTCADQALTA